MDIQDLPRPPVNEHANILRHVAFYMHSNRSLDSKPFPVQPFRRRPPSLLTNDTVVQLLRRLSDSGKPELGI